MSKAATSAPAEGAASKKSYFEQQRDLLMRDISGGMEHVLQNINQLNRSLEGVISVGNEFSSVEALWSHFENVMAKEPEPEAERQDAEEGHGNEESVETAKANTKE